MPKVSEIMTRDVLYVHPDTKVTEATKLMLEHHYNGLPVVNQEGKLIGIICQSDVIVQQKKLPLPTIFTLFDGIIPLTSWSHLEKEVEKISATKVEQAMTPDPVTAGPNTELEEIAEIMVNNNYHTIPVVEEGKLVGIVGKEDVLKTLLK